MVVPALPHISSSLQQRPQPSQQADVSNSALVATHYTSLTALQLLTAFDSLAVKTVMRNHLITECLLHYPEISQFSNRILWPLKVNSMVTGVQNQNCSP